MNQQLRRLLLAVTAIASLAAAGMPAATAHPVCIPTPIETDRQVLRRQMHDRLVAKKFAELDQIVSMILSEYEAGNSPEEDVANLVRAFATRDASDTPLLEEWVRRYPKSYVARLALGAHLHTLAFAARGNALRDETSDEQAARFRAGLAAAQRHVLASMPLSSRPASSFEYAISIAGATGSRREVLALYERAVAIDFEAMSPREAFIWAIDPRWQGRPGDLEAYAAEVANSSLQPELRQYLLYQVEMSLGGYAWARRDAPDAVRHFESAGALCPRPEPWSQLAEAMNDLGQWRAAIGALDRYLALQPGKAWAQRRKAWAYRQLGDWGAALDWYRLAADGGDLNAQASLAKILLEGVHAPRDVDAAIQWLQRAAGQGDAESRARLQQVLDERAAAVQPQ